MNFDGQGGYFYVLVAERGVDFNPIFYTFLKHHFYIFDCKSLNFGLFEVWKKTVASIFIEDQNNGLGF